MIVNQAVSAVDYLYEIRKEFDHKSIMLYTIMNKCLFKS